MTTPIIHPINEKKPELPCWIYLPQNGWTHFTSCAIDAAGFLKIGCAHWSPDSPLPPEVTLEQGKGETGWWCSSCQVFVPPKEVTYNETHDHRAGGCGTSVFQRKISPPASGPSPAAMEKKPERVWLWKNGDHYLAYDSLYPRRANGDPAVLGEPAFAAIIDRKFPREEDGALLDFLQAQLRNMDSSKGGTWLRIGDKGRVQVHRIHPERHQGHVALVWEEDECILDSIPDATNDVRSALRAALQDSREGK